MSGTEKPPCACELRLIYLWDGELSYGELSDDERQDLVEFLAAHGIDPMAVPATNQVTVRARCDGSDWLEVWRTVGDSPQDRAVCEYCANCLSQERVLVPLVELPPPLYGAKVFGVSER